MPYTPTLWQDDVTPTSAENFNHLEDGLQAAAGVADSAEAAATAAQASAASAHAIIDPLTPIVSVKDAAYGAKGDGVTDDTAAIQAAVTATLTSTGGRLIFPAGTYIISGPINIPFSTQWRISGDNRGGTIIKQSANNTPIFKFTNNNTWGWTIHDIQFSATTQQVSTNVQAAGIYVTGAGVEVYNFTIERCSFNFLANGIYSDGNASVWGGEFRDLHVNSSQTRSLIQLVGGGGAYPNNRFEGIYFLANNMVGPLFDMASATSTWITGVEVNQAYLGPTLIKDLAGGSYAIGTFKLETGTYSASLPGQPLFYIDNSQLYADYIELLSITANLTGVAFPRNAFFRADGAPATLRIKKLDLGAVAWTLVTNGTYYVVEGTAIDCVIDSLNIPSSNILLTNLTAEDAADQVKVLSWNDGQTSADQGDNSVTVVAGQSQPNVLSFETALTATRVVTLPQSNAPASNLFNGLRYRVVRSAGGAFDLQIKDNTTLLDTIPQGFTGAIEYVYRRNGWVQTLKELRPLAGTVTQLTNKATGVTLNAGSGQITMNNAALAAGASVSFFLTNSAISPTDVVAVNIVSGYASPGTYRCDVMNSGFPGSPGAGCRIEITNVSAGSLSEALVINFVVIKSS